MTDAFRAHASPRTGDSTWWVEIYPARPYDCETVREVGIDTGLPVEHQPSPGRAARLIDAAEDALALAGWRVCADGQAGWELGSAGDWFSAVERTPVTPEGPSYPVPEDGSLHRDGTRWTSYTPRVSRHPSPVYVLAGAARRQVACGDLALPEGYTLETLQQIQRLTGSYSAAGVIVSDRQARELGEIAHALNDQYSERLEVSDFGDETWAVASILHALETGDSRREDPK